MKWIWPLLIVVSTAMVILISVWRINIVVDEIEYLNKELDATMEDWVENYYMEMDVLVQLFWDAEYEGSAFIERFSHSKDEVMAFWNHFSLMPEILDGVVIIEENGSGKSSIYFDPKQRELMYGYPETMEGYLEYARKEYINENIFNIAFPLLSDQQGLDRPFLYLSDKGRTTLILLDYDIWRNRYPAAITEIVRPRRESIKRLLKINVLDDDGTIISKGMMEDDFSTIPLTLVEIETDFFDENQGGSNLIPQEYKENWSLNYLVRLRNSNSGNNTPGAISNDGIALVRDVNIVGRCIIAKLETRDSAVIYEAIKIQFGGLLLSYTSLILLIVLLFVLTRTNRQSVQMVKRQQSFIANVSHDLRTPLAVICNAGSNLSEGYISDDERVKKYGRLISEEGERLGGMVEGVLMYSGFQAGKIQKERLSGVSFFEEIIKPFRFLFEQKNIRFEVYIQPELEFDGDAQGLSSALSNLLRNAYLHGSSGKYITFCADKSQDGRSVLIRVSDDGPGLSRGEQKKVFQPFTRGEEAERLAVSGSGLGLSLVKQVAELHGGGVSVVSEPGQGAEFILRLPLGEKSSG